MTFEVFKRGSANPSPGAVTVTVQPTGILSLSKAAFELLGEPSTAELLFDDHHQHIGIRACADDSPNGYRVQQRTRTIYGRVFIRFAMRLGDKSVRWEAFMESGMLCVDLTHPGVVITGNRARQVEP